MPKGKFIKRLEEIAAGGPPSIGFKAPQLPLPPALLLAVALPTMDAEHAKAAVEGGAEALIVRVSVQDNITKEEKKLKELLAAADDRPCGVVPVGGPLFEMERLRQLQSLGFDFVVVSAHDTPEVMRLENAGKMMVVDHTLDDDLIKTINGLDVDAVEVSLARPEDFGRDLCIRDIMHYKRLRMLLRKPIIVRGERSVRPQHVADLFDVGVEGLLIDATVTGSDLQSIREATTSYREAIAELGPPRRKDRTKSAPTIPPLKPSTGAVTEEPEEPEEI